jgi:hypothetical protein
LISLDSLGGNEPFQRVALTPRPFFFFGCLRRVKIKSLLCNVRRGRPAAFGALAIRGLSIGAVMTKAS